MKYLLYVLALIVASLYFFPVQFRFMPWRIQAASANL